MRSIFALIIISGLFLGGCDNSEQKQLSNSDAFNKAVKQEPIRIALVMKTLTNPFFVSMENGARKAEQDLDIELLVKTAAQETSISQQIEIVDKLIQDKVRAIVIAPGDSIQLIPVLKKAQDAGIFVVNIDNQLDLDFSKKYGLIDVPFISVDNKMGAFLSAKYISDQIKTPVKAAILEGIRSASNAMARKAGAEKAFSENPLVTIVASETAHWKIDEGRLVTESLFLNNPDIKLLFCANDMMALGAMKFLKDNNYNDVLVAAYDALDEAKQAIKDGDLQVTIDQQPSKQGYMGVETAYKMIKNEKVEQNVQVDVFVINKETIN